MTKPRRRTPTRGSLLSVQINVDRRRAGTRRAVRTAVGKPLRGLVATLRELFGVATKKARKARNPKPDRTGTGTTRSQGAASFAAFQSVRPDLFPDTEPDQVEDAGQAAETNGGTP
jgi:hypothetical protein